MDAQTLAQVFVPFFTTKELGSGTGLGMSLVYELVKKANARIDARSAPGQGTTVEVLFPIVEGHVGETTGAAGAQVGGIDEVVAKEDARILVVEDDIQIMRLLSDLLDREGFSVCRASDGIKALEILEIVSPDLILCDVIMPRMSGPQMVREMNARGMHVPVIFMSGYTDDRLTALDFDPVSVSLVRKPFTAGVLLGRVRQALASERSGPSKPADDEGQDAEVA